LKIRAAADLAASYISQRVAFPDHLLDPPDDRTGGDEGLLARGYFGLDTDSECFRCFRVVERKTAELLYMGMEWDYYYCYRCRGWFRRHFADRRAALPVTDRRVVRHLTWMYTTQMEAAYENRKLVDAMERAWRVLERRLLRL